MKECLTKEQIAQNRDYFIDKLSNIRRDGAQIDKLVEKLDSSDFFYAPATTQYYGSYPGGLCEHSIEVYVNLAQLVNNKFAELGMVRDGKDALLVSELLESVVILGLLHDICKMNRYEQTSRNVKNYCKDGKLSDDRGKFNWEAVSAYQSRSSSDRFIFGSDGETSEFMIRQFIPLTMEESVAIINCKGDTDANQSRGVNLSAIFGKYDLPVLLHVADVLACYIDDLTLDDNKIRKVWEVADESTDTEPTETL